MQRGDRRHGLGESPTSNAADLGKGESASPRRGLEGGTGGGRKEKEGSRGCGCAGPAPATGNLSDALSSGFQGPPSREDGNQFPGCSRETTGRGAVDQIQDQGEAVTSVHNLRGREMPIKAN